MIRISQLLAVLTFAVGICSSNSSHAIVLSVQPVVTKFYNPQTYAELPAIPPGVNPGVPVVVEVGVFMEVRFLEPGEDGFGLVAFSFDLNGNEPGELFSDPDFGGWYANNPCVDSGPGPGGAICLFATNADVGVASDDLEGILVQMATGAFPNVNDPRRHVGEAGSSLGVPYLLGSGYLEWNGQGEVTFTLNPVDAAAKLTNGQFVLGTAVASATLVLGTDVPEPSSLLLTGIGVAVMGLLRRGV